MARLRELQAGFAKAMLDGVDTTFGHCIRVSGLDGERRLQVYRNNVFLSLTEALKAVYPVTQRLRPAAGRQ